MRININSFCGSNMYGWILFYSIPLDPVRYANVPGNWKIWIFPWWNEEFRILQPNSMYNITIRMHIPSILSVIIETGLRIFFYLSLIESLQQLYNGNAFNTCKCNSWSNNLFLSFIQILNVSSIFLDLHRWNNGNDHINIIWYHIYLNPIE